MRRLAIAVMLAVGFAVLGCGGDNQTPDAQSPAQVEPDVQQKPLEPIKPKSPVDGFTNADIQNWCIAAYKGLPDSIATLNDKIVFFEKRLESAQATGDEQAVSDVLRLEESAIVPATELIPLASQWNNAAATSFIKEWIRERDDKGIVSLWNKLDKTKEHYRPAKKVFDDPVRQRKYDESYRHFAGIVTRFDVKLQEFRESWPEEYASQLPSSK